MTLSYKNHSITNKLADFYMTGPLILNMLTKVGVENSAVTEIHGCNHSMTERETEHWILVGTQ